jgi:hypothetical protein
MSQVWTETLMRVGTTEVVNAFIEVSPDGDGLGMVRVCTPTAAGQDWFGKIDFTINPELARELAKALNFVADTLQGGAS